MGETASTTTLAALTTTHTRLHGLQVATLTENAPFSAFKSAPQVGIMAEARATPMPSGPPVTLCHYLEVSEITHNTFHQA